MTTKADWLFRADHLLTAAKQLEIFAAKCLKQAQEYRDLSERARQQASEDQCR